MSGGHGKRSSTAASRAWWGTLVFGTIVFLGPGVVRAIYFIKTKAHHGAYQFVADMNVWLAPGFIGFLGAMFVIYLVLLWCNQL